MKKKTVIYNLFDVGIIYEFVCPKWILDRIRKIYKFGYLVVKITYKRNLLSLINKLNNNNKILSNIFFS